MRQRNAAEEAKAVNIDYLVMCSVYIIDLLDLHTVELPNIDLPKCSEN
jgi:hypothetical protein